MDMAKYLDLFVSEANEHIQSAGVDVTRLASDPASHEAIKSLFRHFHSIKGMAASMGFPPITELSHAVEDLLDRLRKSTLPLPTELPDLMMEALDATGTMVTQAAGGASSPLGFDPARLIVKIRAAIPAAAPAPSRTNATEFAATPTVAAISTAIVPAVAGNNHFLCIVVIDPRAEFPGARAALAVHRLERIGKIIRTDPDRDALLTPRFSGEISVELATDRTAEAVKRLLLDLLDLKQCEVIPIAPSVAAAQPVTGNTGTSLSAGAECPTPSTVRIQTSTLDWFLDSISDMTARRGAMSEALKSGQVARARETMDSLTDSIDAMREQVMQLRLMPFEQVEPRLTRTVREVARRTGKQVTLTITGADVSLDRSVLEEMLDPLNHILRNAVDHGIELSDERGLAGKPAIGSVLIEVSRVSDHVQILITDDGRGIDVDAIRRKAVEGAFLTQTRLAAMDESEILMLTTIPGFSTASRVTEVSGRGVGMDVVRTRVEALRGHMSLQTRRGCWTRIALRMPLTVAVIDAFLVEGKAGLFAVPAGAVASVESVQPGRISSTLSGAFLAESDTGGDTDRAAHPSLIPLLMLDEALGVAAAAGMDGTAPLSRPPLTVLSYQVNGTRAALAVDRIRGRGDLVVRPLGQPLERLRKYSGAALLDDGSLALILDMANLGRSL